MKIRNGFVSNSSTSSFLIFGASFDESEFTEIAKKLGIEDAGNYEIGESVAEKLGLEYHSGQEGYNNYIGKTWDSIKDDETGKQFKDSITEKIQSVIPNKECGSYSEAWYNG